MCLNQSANPYRCACCFECGDCVSTFSIDTDGASDALDGTWSTCSTNELADWFEPTYTAKIKPGTTSGYFATEVYEPVENCFWQAAQYCIDDVDGHRGRAWVVELFFKDTSDVVTSLVTDPILDWTCSCDGPRFEWSFTGDVPDCLGNTDPNCPCPVGDCLNVVVSAFDYDYAGCTFSAPEMTFTAVVKTTVLTNYCLYFERTIVADEYDRQVQIYWQFSRWNWFISYRDEAADCFATNGGIMSDPDSCTGTATKAAGNGFAGAVSITVTAC